MDDLSREYVLQEAIAKAVREADRIILEVSDGSRVETDYLTMQVAKAFMLKVEIALLAPWLSQQVAKSHDCCDLPKNHDGECLHLASHNSFTGKTTFSD